MCPGSYGRCSQFRRSISSRLQCTPQRTHTTTSPTKAGLDRLLETGTTESFAFHITPENALQGHPLAMFTLPPQPCSRSVPPQLTVSLTMRPMVHHVPLVYIQAWGGLCR